MNKIFITTILLCCILVSCKKELVNIEVSEEVEKQEILKIMKAQEKAWSVHDLEGFMQGYWKSDSLKFYGSNGVTSGWNKTLANYKRGYPTKAHSGTLNFKVNDISKVSTGVYFVMGEYHLIRKIGKANGVFMIIFKKIKGNWKIIADTSC